MFAKIKFACCVFTRVLNPFARFLVFKKHLRAHTHTFYGIDFLLHRENCVIASAKRGENVFSERRLQLETATLSQ